MNSGQKCPKCAYTTKTSSSCYLHYVTVHGYSCSKCDFTTVLKRDLKKHVEAIHINQELTCTMCSFKGDDMLSLLVHFKDAHRLIIYHCSQCAFQTRWRPNFHRHKKTLKHLNKTIL